MEVRTVAATVHGRFLYEPRAENRLLISFHGYGENAARSLDDVRKIPGVESWSIAAIQALHPFYVSKTGEIVASWMTGLDRELAIADNIEYVRAVLTSLPRTGHTVFAGFSQGVAMAYRAAANIGGAGVIALAGDVPPDVSTAEARLPPVLLGRGRSDEWYSEEKMRNDVAYLEKATTLRTCVFDGGHEWSDEFRLAAAEFVGSIAR